jgi:hypothetical protein
MNNTHAASAKGRFQLVAICEQCHVGVQPKMQTRSSILAHGGPFVRCDLLSRAQVKR